MHIYSFGLLMSLQVAHMAHGETKSNDIATSQTDMKHIRNKFHFYAYSFFNGKSKIN